MGFLDSEGLAYFWEKVKPGLGGTGGGGVPKGSIIIWSGTASDIPDGWALCDGQDGRPDLRDRFVLGGGGTHPVGETGGEETHTLTVEEMPEHNHGFPLVYNDGTSKIPRRGTSSAGTAYTDNAGGSQPHNNMPPYYVLCYIIKVTDGGSGASGGSLVIQEYDTNDGWHVRKWSDGYMEQTLKKEIANVIINTRWGTGYNSGNNYGPFQYPEAFSELYGVNISGAGSGTSMITAYYDTDKSLRLTKTPGIGVFRPSPDDVGMDFLVFITARGRWK